MSWIERYGGWPPVPGRKPTGMGATAGVLILALLAGCDSNPMGPQPIDRGSCEVPIELIASVVAQPFAAIDLHFALAHAAGPMASALGSSQAKAELAAALLELGNGLGSHSAGSDCQVVLLAASALDNLPDDPATRPDRDGIRLILALAARAVAEGM